jgi:hypothetical protein
MFTALAHCYVRLLAHLVHFYLGAVTITVMLCRDRDSGLTFSVLFAYPLGMQTILAHIRA